MKKQDQRSWTLFLEKYFGLYLYDIDIDKKYIIDDKEIYFVNKNGYASIDNTYNPDETFTDQ